MRTKSATAKLLAVVLALLVIVVAVRESSPRTEVKGDVRGPSAASSDSSARLRDEVYARFDPAFPGRGTTDYPGATVEDIPKSYAMIVLAELERSRHGISPALPNMAGTAGRWLLDNAALNVEGTVGWGLPVAWDAAGDGSENPAGTVYSISTAIAADALMTWMESDPEAPGDEIITTLTAALDAFTRAPTTPDDLLPYSLQPSDQPYDVFNSAAYLAGQMQRFAKYAPSPDLARRLMGSADKTVASLLRNHRTSPSKAWWWRYSLQETNANDMPHASYIIEGLRTYTREGGALSSKVDLVRVVAHLRDFFEAGGRPRAWPTFQTDIDRPPRLYDVGIALNLACSEPEIAPLADKLLRVVGTYRAPADAGFFKFPVGTADQEALVVNEYEAYLWRGLVTCATDELTRGGSIGGRAQKSPAADTTAAPAARGTVPFVRVGPEPVDGEVSFSKGRTTFDLPWSPGRRVVEDGLILQAIDDGAGGALIVRGFPQNDLSLVTLDESGARLGDDPVEVSDGSAPMLRAASFHRGILYVVHYDNPDLTNYLTRFERRDDRYVALGDPLPLPSFEDPSGGTYEMVPPVFLVAADESMHLLGGTLDVTIDVDGELVPSRVPNCLRTIEAVALPEGPVVLCLQKEEHGPGAPYELHGPQGVNLPALEADAGIPFRLRVKDGRVGLGFADTPSRLASMLEFDIERANAGWLEFGTDNVEGRVAWSQIYYLNGFLDFLLLADDSPERWGDFSGVLRGMRSRLDQEMAIVDRHWREGRFGTRAFTVDRSLALFAVQTSRLLLVMQRYLNELADPSVLPGFEPLRADVARLTGHIDVMGVDGQEPWWLPPGAPYLAWPKGSAFSFDGLNAPFNHQNEWAYAVTRAGGGPRPLADAEAIVSHFLRRIAPDGRLPGTGAWDYAWGRAYDGWSEAKGISTNLPEYDGDHISAAISFRSIDAMSALAAGRMLDATTRSHLESSAAALVAKDKLYPFVGYELRRAGVDVELPEDVVRRYIRVSSPWELQNAAWAYSAELERLELQR